MESGTLLNLKAAIFVLIGSLFEGDSNIFSSRK